MVKIFFSIIRKSNGFKVDDVILDYGAGAESFNSNESHGKGIMFMINPNAP